MWGYRVMARTSISWSPWILIASCRKIDQSNSDTFGIIINIILSWEPSESERHILTFLLDENNSQPFPPHLIYMRKGATVILREVFSYASQRARSVT